MYTGAASLGMSKGDIILLYSRATTPTMRKGDVLSRCHSELITLLNCYRSRQLAVGDRGAKF